MLPGLPANRDHVRQTGMFGTVDSFIRSSLLKIGPLESADLERAVRQLVSFNLATADANRLSVDPLAIAFARERLRSEAEWLRAARQRYVEFFRAHLGRAIRRETPHPRYWNALVTGRMSSIDREWPNIQQAMDWAVADGLVPLS